MVEYCERKAPYVPNNKRKRNRSESSSNHGQVRNHCKRWFLVLEKQLKRKNIVLGDMMSSVQIANELLGDILKSSLMSLENIADIMKKGEET